MLARYNYIANERLYEACALLDDVEYRRQRKGSLGSIHGLLNHLLLGDTIWMARFEGGGETTPPLNTILFDEFAALRTARVEQDRRIEAFFASADERFLGRTLPYVNSRGVDYVDPVPVAVAPFFYPHNPHRGQRPVLLSHS